MCNSLLKKLLAAGLIAVTSTTQAGGDKPPLPPAPDPLLVGEMLRIDAHRALMEERAKAASYLAPVRSSSATFSGGGGKKTPEVPAVWLMSIHGVGDQLYAEVQIHGTRVTYMAGRAEPLSAHVSTPYRLRAIRVPCVQLQMAGARSTLERCLKRR